MLARMFIGEPYSWADALARIIEGLGTLTDAED